MAKPLANLVVFLVAISPLALKEVAVVVLLLTLKTDADQAADPNSRLMGVARLLNRRLSPSMLPVAASEMPKTAVFLGAFATAVLTCPSQLSNPRHAKRVMPWAVTRTCIARFHAVAGQTLSRCGADVDMLPS